MFHMGNYGWLLVLVAVLLYIVYTQWQKMKLAQDPFMEKMLEQLKLIESFIAAHQSNSHIKATQTGLSQELEQAVMHATKVIALCHHEPGDSSQNALNKHCKIIIVDTEHKQTIVGACKMEGRAVAHGQELAKILQVPFETV